MINVFTTAGPRPPGGIPRAVTIPNPIGAPTVFSYFAFAVGSDQLAVVREALILIEDRISPEAIIQTCDTAFRQIRGISFSELFYGDAITVTIFRSPTFATRNDSGLTAGQGIARHITLTPTCFNQTTAGGRDRLVLRCSATIVHELAHCAGAGPRPSRAAENTLLQCGFRDQFDPTAVG